MFKINFKIIIIFFFATNSYNKSLGQIYSKWEIKPIAIQTRWAKDVNVENALPEYPRPHMVRSQWQNLNGLWHMAITDKKAGIPSVFPDQILVPFPIESSLSGQKKQLLPTQILWYKTIIKRPVIKDGQRVFLNFGAVDWQATLYVNGKEIGVHTGGYTAFSFDITNALKDGNNDIIVKVFDPTDQGIGPHGKQSLNPSSFYY